MNAGKPLRVGLTGGIASGKSTVAEMLRQLGAVVIDTDQIAREVVQPGSPALQSLRERYGESILDDDGSLRREQLGEIVFASPAEKKWLEQLLHPLIKARADELAQQASEQGTAVWCLMCRYCLNRAGIKMSIRSGSFMCHRQCSGSGSLYGTVFPNQPFRRDWLRNGRLTKRRNRLIW